MCVITAYCNPCGYVSRRRNFELFASKLISQSAYLIVVEVAHGEAAFELNEKFNVVRRRCSDLLWQKERMLNIALMYIPMEFTKVAWLDCDVIFEDTSWAERTEHALDEYTVVQPFSFCARLPPGDLEYKGRCQDGAKIVESLPHGAKRSLDGTRVF